MNEVMNLFVFCYLNGVYIPERFTVHLFPRPSAVLHPGPPGVCCQELWWVSGEALGCGKHPELEADPDSNCGGPIQASPCHPPGLHVCGQFGCIRTSLSCSIGCSVWIVYCNFYSFSVQIFVQLCLFFCTSWAQHALYPLGLEKTVSMASSCGYLTTG